MKTLIFTLVFAICLTASAQDPHFSHIHASPLQNNPAWTGVFNNSVRIITNYRNQWKTPTANFNTFALSLDGRYIVPKTRLTLNGGFSFLTDKGGDLGYGVNTYHALGGATMPIGGRSRSFVTVGAQVGVISQHIDITGVQSIDAEPLLQTLDPKKRSLDVSAGLGYFYALSPTRTVYAGVAVYHINQPDMGMSGQEEVPLYKRWVANVGAMWDLTPRIGIQPSAVLYWQGPHKEITPGSFVSIQLADTRNGYDHNMKLYVGLWARYYISSEFRSGFDALIFSTRYDFDNLAVSFSTDITLSKLAEASTFIGSPELSLIYSFPVRRVKKVKSRVECPAF